MGFSPVRSHNESRWWRTNIPSDQKKDQLSEEKDPFG